MARKKTAPATLRFVEPEDESQDPEDQLRLEATEPDEEEPESNGKQMSKTDAIRAAVAAGAEGPVEGVEYIKREFGIELSKAHFSATKSKLKSSGNLAEKKGTAKAAPRSSVPKAAEQRKPEPAVDRQPAPEQPAGHSGNLLDALEQMKPLIAQYGVDGIKRMANLLG